MKQLIGYEKDLGDTGGKLAGGLGVSGAEFKLELSASYPIEAVIAPATQAFDGMLEKLEAIIPGDQKALLEKLKVEYKEALIGLLSEKVDEQPVLEAAAKPAE